MSLMRYAITKRLPYDERPVSMFTECTEFTVPIFQVIIDLAKQQDPDFVKPLTGLVYLLVEAINKMPDSDSDITVTDITSMIQKRFDDKHRGIVTFLLNIAIEKAFSEPTPENDDDALAKHNDTQKISELTRENVVLNKALDQHDAEHKNALKTALEQQNTEDKKEDATHKKLLKPDWVIIAHKLLAEKPVAEKPVAGTRRLPPSKQSEHGFLQEVMNNFRYKSQECRYYPQCANKNCEWAHGRAEIDRYTRARKELIQAQYDDLDNSQYTLEDWIQSVKGGDIRRKSTLCNNTNIYHDESRCYYGHTDKECKLSTTLHRLAKLDLLPCE